MVKYNSYFYVVVICLIQLSKARQYKDSVGPTCKDETGNDVDWFVVYKLPAISSSSNPLVRNGTAWAYFGPNTPATASDWTLSDLPVTDANSVLGRTVKPIYDNSSTLSNLAYIIYNDQPPIGPTVNKNGHSKGIIISGLKQSIWVVHSIPHFPFFTTNNSTVGQFYPSTATENGQLFICIAIQTNKIDSVGQIFKYTRPNIFRFNIPTQMEPILPVLTSVAKNGSKITSPPWNKLFQIQTAGQKNGQAGIEFQVFAKGPKYQQEIYGEWIAPKLQTGLNVQSWLNGPNPLASNCKSNYSTFNILNKSIDQELFTTHKDHSKWAVGISNTNKWTCLADLNRMEHQLVRGGVSLCTNDIKFWTMFSQLVNSTQPCPRLN